jgi:2-phospho-L-lactate guanylyltransferase
MAQVVIAVRGGRAAKSRLAALLSAQDREVVVEAMLRDMIEAVHRTPRVSGLWVVTPTPALAALAVELGAQVIDQSEPGGLNAAFRQALATVADAAPYDAIALLPGDLPLLEPGDLDAALALAEAHCVVLAPSTDGGTGALALRAGVDFAPSFGPDSFALHREQAARRGLATAVVEAESLAHDLDRTEDAAFLLQAQRPGHTHAFLSSRLPRLTPP